MNNKIIYYTTAFLFALALAYPALTSSFAYIGDFQTVGMDSYVPPEVPRASDPNDPPEYPQGEEAEDQSVQDDPYGYDPDNPYKDWE